MIGRTISGLSGVTHGYMRLMHSESPFERQRLSRVCGSCESHILIKHVNCEHRHGGSQARVIEEYA